MLLLSVRLRGCARGSLSAEGAVTRQPGRSAAKPWVSGTILNRLALKARHTGPRVLRFQRELGFWWGLPGATRAARLPQADELARLWRWSMI